MFGSILNIAFGKFIQVRCPSRIVEYIYERQIVAFNAVFKILQKSKTSWDISIRNRDMALNMQKLRFYVQVAQYQGLFCNSF